MTRREPSEAQRVVLVALEAVCGDGWPGTVREVSEATGVGVSTVHVHLGRLERGGWVQKHPRSVKGGWRPVS